MKYLKSYKIFESVVRHVDEVTDLLDNDLYGDTPMDER